MKSWRSGFMRCRSREEPCGSHHEDASALKCETSVGSTVELGEGGLWRRAGVVVKARVAGDGRSEGEAVALRGCEDWRRQRCIERIARVGVCGFILAASVVVCLSASVMESPG